MQTHDVYWLAGLIEGEGCLSRDKNGKGYAIRIRVAMTDEDVVRKCAAVSGVGHVRGPYTSYGSLGTKPMYSWTVCKKSHVTLLLRAIYPLMGTRRQARIRELLDGPLAS